MRAALLVLAAAGCASAPSEVIAPRQDEAVALVWHEMLGRAEEPPAVEWVFAEPCKGRRWGAIPLDRGADGTCADGYYAPGSYRVVLMIPSWSPAEGRPFGVFSSSALVHEDVHAMLELATGDMDAEHQAHPEWWAVVPFAEAVLAVDGL